MRARSKRMESKARGANGGRARPGAACLRDAGRSAPESPLVWLSRRADRQGRPLVDATQLDAGERLGEDFWLGQMIPHVTTNYTGVISGHPRRRAAPRADLDAPERVVAAQERVRRALTAVGPELSGILIDVCCHSKGLEDVERVYGWSQRSAKIVLGLALTSLARHYGLLAAGDQTSRGAAIRHWGASGYRPTLDDWRSGAE